MRNIYTSLYFLVYPIFLIYQHFLFHRLYLARHQLLVYLYLPCLLVHLCHQRHHHCLVYLYIYIHIHARLRWTSIANPRPILKFMPDLYIRATCTSDLCHIFSSNTQIGVPILKTIAISQFFSFLTSNDVTAVCPIITLTLIVTNTSEINLRIWKGRLFENTIKSDSDLR